jgi:Tol biopolymer transport system component
MRRRVTVLGLVLFVILLSGALVYGFHERGVQVDKYSTMDRPPRIHPDYCSTVIPPNISPLNFTVKEKGSYYFARIYSDKGEAIEVSGRSPKILIPIDSWHVLLDKNRGGQVHFDVFVRTDDRGWVRFGTITNRIANEDVDNYLVYRRTHPTNTLSRGRVGIYQRDLRCFNEKTVLDNHLYKAGCTSCHTFCGNRPDNVLISVRNLKSGPVTLLIEDGVVSKIDAKFGYTTWHPSGKLVAYSLNKLPMFLHTARRELRDTMDIDSVLLYFVVDSKAVRTSPQISKKDQLENWPAWSADGRYLYFCSTPKSPILQEKKFPPDEYDQVKYNLVRVSYDLEHDQWGEAETVLSSKDTGLSIAMPRFSPDGRWLIFCMCDYGCFPPWQVSSDLYIVDMKAAEETGRYEYRRLDISSDQSESWHSWSSNSRWLIYSSKKEHGVFTKCYISYVDETGKAYKPLVVPQEDPELYNYCLETFNTPEFVTGPITAIGEQLARAVRGSAKVSVKMPITMATPKAGPDKGPSLLELE